MGPSLGPALSIMGRVPRWLCDREDITECACTNLDSGDADESQVMQSWGTPRHVRFVVERNLSKGQHRVACGPPITGQGAEALR